MLDTSGANISDSEIAKRIQEYKLSITRSDDELRQILVMYEAKWARLNEIIDRPETTAAERLRYNAKKLRILIKYRVIQRYLGLI